MSYFNHAFSKMFIGTGATRTPGSPSVTDPATDEGFITTTGVETFTLSQANLGPGYFGVFNPESYQSLDVTLDEYDCCPILLVSASLKANDKQGPFHGGYQESNKSKLINPKYVRRFYRVDQCVPSQAVVHIGNTVYTDDQVISLVISSAGSGYTDGTYSDVPLTGGTGTGATADIEIVGGVVTVVTLTDGGTGYTNGDVLVPDPAVVGTPIEEARLTSTVNSGVNCCKEFFCDETYYLRVDIKGSPAIRFANHNLYRTFDAYTGCCADPTPSLVDSTIVFIQWAKQMVEDPYMKDFVLPVVFDETGAPWFANSDEAVAAGYPSSQTIFNYTEQAHTPDACAGLRLVGAYVDTKFGNCSFQVTDHFETDPIEIYASLVDYVGDPCTFEGLCVVTECKGLQGMGFGETVVRDLLKYESYLQNFFHSDIRIREITQGNQLLNTIDRNALYTKYYIQHSVPRYNNPTGTFDNDQYLLEIVTNGAIAAFETFMENWLDSCANCVSFEELGCNACTPVDLPDAP